MMGHSNRILIVDDDTSSLEVLCEVLARAGYDVIAANNGYETLERIQQNSIDLAILDFNLPDTTGLELLQQIKRFQPGVPVIIMSANTAQSVKLDVFEAGAYTFIPKPIDLKQLLRFVTRGLHLNPSSQGVEVPAASTPTIQIKRSIFFRWIQIIIKK